MKNKNVCFTCFGSGYTIDSNPNADGEIIDCPNCAKT